jgi:hypothetical protein
MSSERRVIRPYRNVDGVQNVLDEVVLGFGGARIEAWVEQNVGARGSDSES